MRRLAPAVVLVALTACNDAPDGLQVSISPAEPTTLDALVVSIDSEAVDPNAKDQVAYSYQWSLNDLDSDNTSDTVPAGDTRKGQTWTVRVTPTDGAITGPAATASVTVVNTAPVVAVELSPASPDTNDRLVATATPSDADNDPLAVTFAWTVDGTLTTVTEAQVPDHRTRKGEVWEVQVTANDGEVDSEIATASVVIGNTPPTNTGIKVLPGTLDRTSTATCTGTGYVDVDGDPEGYQVTWHADGADVGTGETLAIAPYARGTRIACTGAPFDGTDVGLARTSAEVVVKNTPPSLASVEIGPADPLTATEVTATLTGLIDLDDDAITPRYSWRVNGNERATTATLDGKRFVAGDKIVLMVTPFDGTEAGTPVVSNELRAGNTVPVVSDLALSPSAPATNDTLNATATASDLDGSPVTLSYAWYVNGSMMSATGSALDGTSSFDKHDEVYVVVTPNDGIGDGLPVTSSTVTVLNTPPAAPRLGVDPLEPTDSDDVTCEIAAQDPDVDGDAISYTFSWTVDGAAYTNATTTHYAGDTVPASDRSAEEEWICTVTPNDGDDNGASARRKVGLNPPSALEPSGSLVASAFRGGTMPGTTYNEDCPSGEFAVGMSVDLTRSGGYFASMATRCAPLDFACEGETCTVSHGTITTGTYRGGSGSLIEVSDCDDGEVVTGFFGRMGWYVDQIGLSCSPVELEYDGDAWVVSVGSSTDLTAVGGTGGSAVSRADCATDSVATRMVIRAASSQVDGFGLGCQEITAVEE